jgi:hypothetical protein
LDRLSQGSRSLRLGTAGPGYRDCMASPLVLARRVPWMRAWLVAQWLYRHGRERLERNLDPPERAELWQLMRKSKGRPVNLEAAERDRFVVLVRQAARGR